MLKHVICIFNHVSSLIKAKVMALYGFSSGIGSHLGFFQNFLGFHVRCFRSPCETRETIENRRSDLEGLMLTGIYDLGPMVVRHINEASHSKLKRTKERGMRGHLC